MPSSFRTIPSTANHLSIGCAAVCICGQTGSRTNQGQAITPFMFNEEEYHVSCLPSLFPCVLTIPSITGGRGGVTQGVN